MLSTTTLFVALAIPEVLGFVPNNFLGTTTTTRLRATVEEDKQTKKRLFEEQTIESWTSAWDDDLKERHGFDWEMEKLRRKLDDMPLKIGGPDYWRRFIEENPDSTYRRYAGSTYPGAKPGGVDAFRILLNNLLQFLLGNDSEDQAPVASWDWRAALREQGPFKLSKSLVTGDLQTIVGGPLFLLLTKYHREVGPVFKLAFGPRSFIVVADPAIAKHVLKDKSENFDKGILSEILKPILGQGLIPADPDVWKRRRRVIAPGFHRKWLDQTLATFHDCTDVLVDDLRRRADTTNNVSASFAQWPAWKKNGAAPSENIVDIEERFCSTSLDIIGRAVFNYDFGSATAESPLVRAVYRCLAEAERRTTAFFPFWLIPGARHVIPNQREFHDDLDLLNGKLDQLILDAQQQDDDEEPEVISLLDFLVTMRGEEATNAQLRDDLMTMLVAGHETTAALLTWVVYELFHPSGRSRHHLAAIRDEIDAIFDEHHDGYRFTYEDVRRAKKTRFALAEGLRLYPQPPLLIRRALDADELPRPSFAYPAVSLSRGTDVFLSTWSLHKSPLLWDDPETFDPTRFERKKDPVPGVSPAGWKGYDPSLIPDTALYPNEQSADYAFVPFGAGGRRCLGDQFAVLEATIMLATLLRHFDLDFAIGHDTLAPQQGLGGLPVADVGMRTGATIHTEAGLWTAVKRRVR
mmetsp:Transcript_18474/g.56737  ORF Transcript_18474/g.56737 Transcript_18474/m.56737 type:complete len:691 (+) Transcript_18474:78-2150(+)